LLRRSGRQVRRHEREGSRQGALTGRLRRQKYEPAPADASRRTITPPMTAYTTAARPQFTAVFAFALLRWNTFLNGVTSHRAPSSRVETIELLSFAPSTTSRMPITISATTRLVTSLTIRARNSIGV